MLSKFSAFAIFFLGATACNCEQSTPINSFDYVIVGGGTSGLVLANRLSELPRITVAVIEVGASVLDNVNVTGTGNYGLAFGTAIDWAFETVNQSYAGGQKKTLRAGKAIGGTSTINGMAYTRAEDVQIDAWETIGNTGWNWANLFPYYKKSEELQIPNAAQVEAGASWDPVYHGSTGPLNVGWTLNMPNTSIPTILNSTYQSLGIPYSHDISGGKMHGYNIFPRTVDTLAGVREDAARAYYWPFLNRTNLHLYANTLANRIVWANSRDCDAVARGVEVTDSDGKTYTIRAKREVILSAGALKSPAILELSGIGNPDILQKYGIDVVVDLPTVGENLQDQTNNGLASKTSNSSLNFTGEASYVAYPAITDILSASDVSSLASSVLANLSSYATIVSAASGNVTKAADLLKLFQLQHELIFNATIPIAEILVAPAGNTLNVEFWALLPFSRGSVHIASANASVPPTINPNYFMLDWDMDEQVATAKFIRKILATDPFSALVGIETKPGLGVIAADASEEMWSQWILDTYRSNFHPVATAAMMPQEIGGVVDNNLKVYGTTNVRVVDASVLPFQVCGHLVSTLYAVSERAADIIKAAQ